MAVVLTYPLKVMRITQGYTGTTSHKPHWYGRYKNNKGKYVYGTLPGLKDWPWDEGGKDQDRDPMYAPCDHVVKKIYGRGNRGVNTIWLESTEKVEFADGTIDYVTFMIIHPNDSDIKRLYEGMLIKKGAYVCYEGIDGATGNHLHISVGTGKMSGGGWAQNVNGKWVITVTGAPIKPENAFYIDPSFTTVKSKGGISFKTLPKKKAAASTTPAKTEPTPAPAKTSKYKLGDYKVTTNVLNVRTGAGTSYPAKSYDQLTPAAQKDVVRLFGTKVNGFVKGMVFTVLEVNGDWGRCPSGWVCLDYCKKI